MPGVTQEREKETSMLVRRSDLDSARDHVRTSYGKCMRKKRKKSKRNGRKKSKQRGDSQR